MCRVESFLERIDLLITRTCELKKEKSVKEKELMKTSAKYGNHLMLCNREIGLDLHEIPGTSKGYSPKWWFNSDLPW